ncbi:MAG: hypothetical protein R2941_01665 [Desulfobacterales bacterium]
MTWDIRINIRVPFDKETLARNLFENILNLANAGYMEKGNRPIGKDMAQRLAKTLRADCEVFF